MDYHAATRYLASLLLDVLRELGQGQIDDDLLRWGHHYIDPRESAGPVATLSEGLTYIAKPKRRAHRGASARTVARIEFHKYTAKALWLLTCIDALIHQMAQDNAAIEGMVAEAPADCRPMLRILCWRREEFLRYWAREALIEIARACTTVQNVQTPLKYQ